jgi:hypothetical protein
MPLLRRLYQCLTPRRSVCKTPLQEISPYPQDGGSHLRRVLFTVRPGRECAGIGESSKRLPFDDHDLGARRVHSLRKTRLLKGNGLYRLRTNYCFVSGHDFSRPLAS